MNSRLSSIVAARLTQAQAPSLQDGSADSVKDRTAPVTAVGEHLSDELREQVIKDTGAAMVRAHTEGRKDHARELLRLQNLLIAGRSAQQVAKLEEERGLR